MNGNDKKCRTAKMGLRLETSVVEKVRICDLTVRT